MSIKPGCHSIYFLKIPVKSCNTFKAHFIGDVNKTVAGFANQPGRFSDTIFIDIFFELLPGIFLKHAAEIIRADLYNVGKVFTGKRT